MKHQLLLTLFSLALGSIGYAAPKSATYTCTFSKFTNGQGVAAKTATLNLAPGSEPTASLVIGDHRGELDFYWTDDANASVGLNLYIWHDGDDKRESSVHVDSLDKHLHLNMQDAGPDHYSLDCTGQIQN